VSQILTEYYNRPPTAPPPEPPEPGGTGRKPGPPGAPDPLTLPRLMWSGPAARLPKALDKLAKDLESCPPSRALVMLHPTDVAAIRHRLLECIQVLEDAVAGLDNDDREEEEEEEEEE